MRALMDTVRLQLCIIDYPTMYIPLIKTKNENITFVLCVALSKCIFNKHTRRQRSKREHYLKSYKVLGLINKTCKLIEKK